MFLYPKTKGQVEDACAELNFDKLTIYQPGLLLCDRQENRLGERIAQCIAKPLFSMLGASSGSIPCDMVAHGLLFQVFCSKITLFCSHAPIGYGRQNGKTAKQDTARDEQELLGQLFQDVK